MRTLTRFGIGMCSVGAAVAVAVSPAAAAPYSSGTISSPTNNTIVYRITNLTDSVRSCEAFLSGRVKYTTPRKRIPPKTTEIFTVAGVPAGNYSTWWACSSFANGKQVVTVLGASSGTPHLTENAPAAGTFGLSGLGSLFGGFGSS